MPVKMTKSEAQKLAKKTIEHSKKHGLSLNKKTIPPNKQSTI
ncbi:hypothetical protein [Virgibacillus necropolis]